MSSVNLTYLVSFLLHLTSLLCTEWSGWWFVQRRLLPGRRWWEAMTAGEGCPGRVSGGWGRGWAGQLSDASPNWSVFACTVSSHFALWVGFFFFFATFKWWDQRRHRLLDRNEWFLTASRQCYSGNNVERNDVIRGLAASVLFIGVPRETASGQRLLLLTRCGVGGMRLGRAGPFPRKWPQ